MVHNINQTIQIKHKRATGKYIKSWVNDDGLHVNGFSPVEGFEEQRAVGFILFAFALKGGPLMVKQTSNPSLAE